VGTNGIFFNHAYYIYTAGWLFELNEFEETICWPSDIYI